MGNTVSALTAQQTFQNNFEDIVSCREDIQEDKSIIKTLSVTLQVRLIIAWEKNIYMLPSDMNLSVRSRTVGYNNKIL